MEVLSGWFYNVDTFLLIFLRVTALLSIVPIFGSRNLPTRVRIGISFILAAIFLPLVLEAETPIPSALIPFVLVCIKELLIGLLIGFVAYLAFTAIQVAGQFIDVRMGFAIANVVDPQYEVPVPLVGQFKYFLALLIFLGADLHHFFLKGLYETFRILPPGTAGFPSGFIEFLIQVTNQIFIFAFQIALPLMGIIFIIDVAIGIVARTVPQMNIFILGFPIKILVGLVSLVFTLPYFISGLDHLFAWMTENIQTVIALLAQGGN